MKKKQRFEAQLTKLSLTASIPLLLLLLFTMNYADVSIWLIILTALLGGILVALTGFLLHHRAEYQFRSLSNLLEAMTQGEYSLRAVSDESGGAHDELVLTINGLAEQLAEQRWQASESQLLVRTIIDHIDVAIIALTPSNQISFLNPTARKLFQLEADGTEVDFLQQLAFVQSFSSGQHQVVDLSLAQQQGRFNVHVEEFRKSGEQHKLLFISDVTILLRSEERKAWQSLVRVISHEINNSLSPIASIGQTLRKSVQNGLVHTDDIQNLVDGLSIITERANGLSQFVESYKQLAKLPSPQKKQVSIKDLLQKTCDLFEAQKIEIKSTEDRLIYIDAVQFEQVLINLIKNAIEAKAQTNPDSEIMIECIAGEVLFKLQVFDEGCGISNPDNLFVPFYSTKVKGSGIGLVLCRQIIEAHGGRLTVKNRQVKQGAVAIIELPLKAW